MNRKETARLAEIAQCEQAILLQPEVLSHHWRLGLLHLLQGNGEEAQSVWLSAMMALDPAREAEQLADLLHLLQTEADQQLAHRPDLAEILCHQALELNPDQPEIYALLGRAVCLQGDLEAAIELWQQAIQQNPNWAEPYRYQTQVWYKLGHYQRAIAAGLQAVNLQPDWQTHHCLGVCFGYLHAWESAVDHFQQAIQLHPHCPMLHADLGWAWLWLKQPQTALNHFRVALKEQSSFAVTYIDWAELLDAAGRDDPDQLKVQLLKAICDPTASTQFAQLLQAVSQRQITQPTAQLAPTALCEFHETTHDWAATQPSDCYQALDPDSTMPLTPPRTLDPEVHFSFRFGRAVPLPGSFVAKIPAGRVWFAEDQSSTAIFTAANYLLGDLSVEFPLLSPFHPDKHPSLHSARFRDLPPVEPVTGTVAVLSGLTDDMYFHWMFDVLPRIDLLRRSGIDFETIDYFLVSNHLPFQQQTLERLGISVAKILPVAPHLQATALIVPSFPASPAWMPQWACEFLRRVFLPQAVSATSSHTNKLRLYLSRQTTANRRLINETDCWSVLQRFGFQAVNLETLSVSEQAELLAQAEIVVALHGSGLTNIVFCQPGTKVIELFSPYYVYPCYWLISNLVQLEYYYLLGSTPMGTFLHQLLYPNPRIEDIWIDPTQLEALLQLAVQDRM
jgi:tetratricopeptide (TPR) repeat protein